MASSICLLLASLRTALETYLHDNFGNKLNSEDRSLLAYLVMFHSLPFDYIHPEDNDVGREHDIEDITTHPNSSPSSVTMESSVRNHGAVTSNSDEADNSGETGNCTVPTFSVASSSVGGTDDSGETGNCTVPTFSDAPTRIVGEVDETAVGQSEASAEVCINDKPVRADGVAEVTDGGAGVADEALVTEETEHAGAEVEPPDEVRATEINADEEVKVGTAAVAQSQGETVEKERSDDAFATIKPNKHPSVADAPREIPPETEMNSSTMVPATSSAQVVGFASATPPPTVLDPSPDAVTTCWDGPCCTIL